MIIHFFSLQITRSRNYSTEKEKKNLFFFFSSSNNVYTRGKDTLQVKRDLLPTKAFIFGH